MKKILSLLLLITMTSSLCACNQKSGETQSANNTNATQSTDGTDKSAETDTNNQIQPELTEQNTITIEGTEYSLPISVKAFLSTGWNDTYDDLKNERIINKERMKY